MKIEILNTMKHSAKENMQLDQKLLDELDPDGLPILHLYQWNAPSLTYGYFTKPEKLLNLDEIERKKIEIAKRPTGGGVTFHFCDYAFSFLLPSHHPAFCSSTLENYRFVNQFVLEAVQKLLKVDQRLGFLKSQDNAKVQDHLNFCMAKPTQYDVLLENQKVGGAAQRKKQQGYLHQGTISIALPDRNYLSSILKSEKTLEAIFANTFYWVPNHLETEKVNQVRMQVEKLLIAEIEKYPI